VKSESSAPDVLPPLPFTNTLVPNNDDSRKRNRPNALDPTPATIRSPTRTAVPSFSSKSNSPRSSRGPKTSAADSNSREPTIHKKALAAITNNAKISDFFALTKPKRPTAQSSLSAITLTQNEVDLGSNENGASTTDAAGPGVSDTHALDALQRRYDELLRTCQDKDEQLKAVSNNRTILHTALQSALRQRENEYEALKVETEEKDAKYRDALEELVRTDACQEARELREKLAADGARLGRILSVPRSGGSRMLLSSHRAPLESWEDGYASKELQEKLNELQTKKVILEERQKVALLAEENFGKDLPRKQDDSRATDDQGDGFHLDNPPVTALDVREAVESARYLLSNIRQQERELALAEQALNDEKGAHIRALKRVASEDASRFRTRPKLHDRYVLRSLLGKGGFSEVWLAFDLIKLREVAVKIHQLDSRWPDSKKENYTKHVSREYEIHRSVRHPRIVSLYDVFEIDNNSFATVLESCEGTDLDTLLKVKRRLPEQDARAILLQILSGMNYLSHPSKDGTRQGIIHYDLKPGNILFDQFGDAKITDFGLSKIVDAPDPGDSMELTSQGAGTYWYLPPECFILDDDVRISNKVDVWSIGVIFYQMLFGKRPFGDGQSQDMMLKDGTMLHARSVLFPERPEVTCSCKEFIEACLTYDQQFRPTIAQICEHPYVLEKDLRNKL
jgi:tousled-like kinase